MKTDRRNRMNGISLLRRIPDNSIKLVFFDPQYREVLDHLKFGNEGERQKGRAKLAQMDSKTIREFGREIARVLRPSGYVALWCDKFIVCNGLAPSFFRGADVFDPNLGMMPGEPLLQMVDMVTWDKGRIGMGKRSRRRGEYVVFLQKPPIKARATWRTMPCIPDVWQEKIEDRTHAHQKPLGLQQAIIEATTNRGSIVVDPCAGSYSVMTAAHACGRRFLGCDLQ